MKKRRWLAGLTAAVLLLWQWPLAAAADGGRVLLYDNEDGEVLSALLEEDAQAWPTAAPVQASGLDIRAKGAVLMDQGSGTVLYEKDAYTQLPIASVTKVMTLLLVMEAIDAGQIAWTDQVSCSARAASMGGSQIWLEPGEIMTVEELVKSAAVVSANDACTALAEHLCGSLEAFVERMNTRAAELSMENTHFVDCSGLDDTGYSCAYDVAVMSRQLMTHPDITRFTTIWMDTLRGGKSQLVNTNKLVRHYSGATGLKTGTTQAAGHCLAATAEKNGTAFVAVVLGCTTTADRFNGARAMLDHAFASYVAYTPPVDTLSLQPIPVRGGREPQVALTVETPEPLLLKKGTEKAVESTVELAEDLEAPVEKGQIVGTWRLTAGEETLGEYPVCAAEAVAEMDLRTAYALLYAALLR